MNRRQIPPATTLQQSFRLYQPKPGHPDWADLGKRARELAAKVRPQLERPGRRRLGRRMLKAYRTAVGNFGLNLKLSRQGRDDLRPLYFIWTMLRACNFRCTYCDDHRGRMYPDLSDKGKLSTAEGKDLLRIMRSRTPSVYFAGGEPTARKDLPELTREAAELGYYPIVINTNASLIPKMIVKDSWKTWLADTDIVVVSLDGLDLAAMGDLWVTKTPSDVFLALLLLRDLAEEMKVKLLVNTVIQPGRVHLARDVLDFACDTGIWFTPVPMNVGPRVHDAFRDDPEYEALVQTILERKRQGHRITGSLRMNERLLRSAPLECKNTLKPHVDFDGKLIWPCKAAVNTEPEYIDILQFEDLDSLYEHARQQISPDGFHGPGPDQCGADCNWAQNYTTDTYAHGLRHPMSLLREVFEFLGPA